MSLLEPSLVNLLWLSAHSFWKNYLNVIAVGADDSAGFLRVTRR